MRISDNEMQWMYGYIIGSTIKNFGPFPDPYALYPYYRDFSYQNLNVPHARD